MAADNNSTPARFDTLHELLTRAQALGVTVQLHVHDVPTAAALEWLQLGLLDGIEQGAGGNPPTGTMESGSWGEDGKAIATVFTDGPRLTMEQREAATARVAEELATNTALLEELRRTDELKEEQS